MRKPELLVLLCAHRPGSGGVCEQAYRARGSSLGKHPASRGNRAHAAAGDAPACGNRGGTSSGSGCHPCRLCVRRNAPRRRARVLHKPKRPNPAAPKPAPPQISPQLSAKDLAATRRIRLRISRRRKRICSWPTASSSTPRKKTSAEKINGFLGQAHEAITADDWVRAQNLAEKARVLSVELVKSF